MKVRSWLGVAFAITILGAIIYRTSTFRPMMNFHSVDPGKFYRSAQLTPDEFKEVVAKYGIKTVVNLRGHQDGEWWYNGEKETLGQLGVRFETIGFSTDYVQPVNAWTQYLDILKTAERPILVHCRSGADRTGEASAIYAMEYMHKSREEALDQLSPLYLHFEPFKRAKKLFVRNYQGSQWLRREYDPCAEPFREYLAPDMKCSANPH